jgi:outer membrane protein TolC
MEGMRVTVICVRFLTYFYRTAFVLGLLLTPALGQQSRFQGSVPTGTASPTPHSLTLRDAIDRGLRTNLGLLVSGSASDIARGERMRALSSLLPQVNGSVSETVEQLNLKTVGLNFQAPGGFSIPTIVGPFHFTDVRASSSFSVFDYNLRKNYRASQYYSRRASLSGDQRRSHRGVAENLS